MRFNAIATSTLIGATTVLAGCSDSTGAAAGRPVSVSFATASARTAPSLSPASMGVSRSITTTSGAHTIVINKAQVVVARMELERDGAACASESAAGDDAQDEHECADLTLAPSIVDLPVDASVAGALQIMIPAGTYRKLEAKVRAIRADGEHGDKGKASGAFLAAHPEFAGVSVRVEGTYDGKAFTWTGAPRADFETEFNPSLVVDAAPVNLTVHVDIASWFRDGTGMLIDPASTSTTDASMIASNIKRSFRAFHDDDRNDHDDADERH